MKKAFVLLLGLFIAVSSGRAQVKFRMGEYNYIPKYSLNELVGIDETGFYFLFENTELPKQKLLEKYDINLKRILSKKLHFIPDGKDRKYEFIYYSNNKIYLFSSYIRPSPHSKRVLDVQTINKETLELNQDLKEVANVVNFYAASGSFEFKLSPDRSKLLIFCDHPYIANETEIFGFKVLDANLEEIWSRDIAFSADEISGLESMALDNDGNIILKGIYFDKADKEKAGKQKRVLVGGDLLEKMNSNRKKKLNYQYHIQVYRKEEKNPQVFKVGLEGKYIKDLTYLFVGNGDFVCSGFYSEPGLTDARGIYYFLFDGSTSVVNKSSTVEFGMDFITANLTEIKIKELKKKLEKGESIPELKFHAKDLIVRGEEIILIGELIKTLDNIPPPPLGYNNLSIGLHPYIFYSGYDEYRDIAVFNLNQKGNINWVKKIAKEQGVEKGKEFISYGVTGTMDKLYLFYNDHPANVNIPSPDKLHRWAAANGGVTMMAEVDRDGGVKKTIVIDTKETDVIMQPSNMTQIGDNAFLIYGERGDRRRFGIITFE